MKIKILKMIAIVGLVPGYGAQADSWKNESRNARSYYSESRSYEATQEVYCDPPRVGGAVRGPYGTTRLETRIEAPRESYPYGRGNKYRGKGYYREDPYERRTREVYVKPSRPRVPVYEKVWVPPVYQEVFIRHRGLSVRICIREGYWTQRVVGYR